MDKGTQLKARNSIPAQKITEGKTYSINSDPGGGMFGIKNDDGKELFMYEDAVLIFFEVIGDKEVVKEPEPERVISVKGTTMKEKKPLSHFDRLMLGEGRDTPPPETDLSLEYLHEKMKGELMEALKEHPITQETWNVWLNFFKETVQLFYKIEGKALNERYKYITKDWK
jgi:hypothetical protein